MTQLDSLSSVLKTLRDQAAEHGRDRIQFNDQEFPEKDLTFIFSSPLRLLVHSPPNDKERP